MRRYYIYRKADLPRAGYSFSGLTRDKLKIWVEDFTYVPFRGKFYYLAAVLKETLINSMFNAPIVLF